ncbi:MAG TPA: hypothetical protein PLN31_08710 [Azoarcus taiwanensis]|nr:hypothetical protein [Azoarcus taiwanensis]
MNFKRMIDKLGLLLSADRRMQEEKKKKLKELLKKMKAEQKRLKIAIAHCSDPDARADFELKLQILTEQRKKGVNLRKRLAGKA